MSNHVGRESVSGLSCLAGRRLSRQLSGVKRTPNAGLVAAANDPKRTAAAAGTSEKSKSPNRFWARLRLPALRGSVWHR